MKLEIMDSSPCVVEQNIITFIDSELYKAAAIGQIDPFNSYTEPLNLLLTPTKNTILHIHISQQLKGSDVSNSFTKQILAKCPSLLLQTNNRGETPLHMAARHGLDTILQFLIDSAKDIESGAGSMLRMENIDKETALHEAARHNNLVVVEILTKEDPDFTYLANRLGETPLYLAVERGYCNILSQILHACTSPAYHGPNGRTILHEAVIRNNSEMTSKIVEANKTLAKKVDRQGWAPLHHASHFGHLSIVKLLLECDKSVAYIADKDGIIPLHLAAYSGKSHEKVVFSILEHCPDCHELVDHKGRNVLHFAVQSRSDSLLDNLLEGSNNNDYYLPLMANLVNQKDVDGNTPLHLLASYCIDNTRMLWHPHVDKMAVNNINYTPLDVLSKSADNHYAGTKGFTLGDMKRYGGYELSQRNFIELPDKSHKDVDMEEVERIKTSHIIVAALIVTVTFTAGFTLPGGYDSNKGTAILSRNGAFATFIITDALALLLSTCALFFCYSMEYLSAKRRKQYLLGFAGLFIMVSIFLMLMAFVAAVFAVLHDSTYLRVIIFLITSFSVLMCYSPLKNTLISLFSD